MDNDSKDVIVTDIKMPFISMVVFMVKWVLASIPALIVLYLIMVLLIGLLGGLGGIGHHRW